MNGVWQTLREKWSAMSDKKVRILLGIGLAGIVIIALSECFPSRDTADTAAAPTVTADQVEAALESRIADLLGTVEGVGRCRVMVTLESDARAVYAADTTVSDTATSEQYLSVDTEGGPVGLLLTTIRPTVKGVVVVCDGGVDPDVCRRVTQVVTTAFHISERRVCVVRVEQ